MYSCSRRVRKTSSSLTLTMRLWDLLNLPYLTGCVSSTAHTSSRQQWRLLMIMIWLHPISTCWSSEASSLSSKEWSWCATASAFSEPSFCSFEHMLVIIFARWTPQRADSQMVGYFWIRWHFAFLISNGVRQRHCQKYENELFRSLCKWICQFPLRAAARLWFADWFCLWLSLTSEDTLAGGFMRMCSDEEYGASLRWTFARFFRR